MYLKNCLPRRDEVLSMVRSRQGISRRGFRMRDGSMRGWMFIHSVIHPFIHYRVIIRALFWSRHPWVSVPFLGDKSDTSQLGKDPVPA
jgi:hypothetical protein